VDIEENAIDCFEESCPEIDSNKMLHALWEFKLNFHELQHRTLNRHNDAKFHTMLSRYFTEIKKTRIGRNNEATDSTAVSG
jgi:hypothetical protein